MLGPLESDIAVGFYRRLLREVRGGQALGQERVR